MGGKLDIMRHDLRPGSGVLVETKENHWEWGSVVAKHNGGCLVEFFPRGEKSWKQFFHMSAIWPEDYDYNNETEVALGNVVTLPNRESKPHPILQSASLPWVAPEPINHLFVYGTLKQQGRLHHYLEGLEFVGEDFTKLRNYNMFSVGDRFPAVTRWKGTSAIQGEIYKLPEDDKEILEKLDAVEGVPNLYKRDDMRTLKHDLKCYFYLSSLKVENAYFTEMGQRISFDLANKAYVWRN